jgi:hypothetical protein
VAAAVVSVIVAPNQAAPAHRPADEPTREADLLSRQANALSREADCQGSGAVVAYGNWECGTPEAHSPWRIMYNVGAAHSFQRRSDIEPRQGAYAARFEVRPGDFTGFGERSEANRAAGHLTRAGDDLYYAFSVRHGAPWPPCQGHCTVAQWLQVGETGTPPLALSAPEGSDSEADVGMQLKHRAGRCVPPQPGEMPNECEVNEVHEMFSAEEFTATLGSWHDWIIHVRWSPEADGLIEVWHRVEGDDDFDHWSLSDVPTMKKINGDAPALESRLGIYREPQPGTHIADHDGYCVATTLEAAESCLS